MSGARNALACVLLLGCNTAARFDVEAEQVVGGGVLALNAACEGDGFVTAVVLLNQQGGAVRVGGGRIPSLPSGAADGFSLTGVTGGRETYTATVESVNVVAHPEETSVTAVLDRSGAACAALPPGPWSPGCNLTPCGAPGDGCSVEAGCCEDDQRCAGIAEGRALTQSCVEAAEECDSACGKGEVCHDGACHPMLHGPLDPGEQLPQRFASTTAHLLDAEVGPLSPPVGATRALQASEAGLLPLTAGPVAEYASVTSALALRLQPPFGASRLLADLARAQGDDPVVVWAFEPGPAADLSTRPAHLFAVVDHPLLDATADAAFASAACASGGFYGRFPPDAEQLDTVASTWLPAAVRSHLQLEVTLTPAPPPGTRVTGRLRIDVRRVVGAGTRPSVAVVEQPFDIVVGGAP